MPCSPASGDSQYARSPTVTRRPPERRTPGRDETFTPSPIGLVAECVPGSQTTSRGAYNANKTRTLPTEQCTPLYPSSPPQTTAPHSNRCPGPQHGLNRPTDRSFDTKHRGPRIPNRAAGFLFLPCATTVQVPKRSRPSFTCDHGSRDGWPPSKGSSAETPRFTSHFAAAGTQDWGPQNLSTACQPSYRWAVGT